MKTKEIRDLIEFISQTGLNEVNIETEELKISIKRNPDVAVSSVQAAPVVQTLPQTPAPPTLAADNQAAGDATAPASSGNFTEVKAPMIGTFYRSSNPDSEPFVSVGDTIEKGQVVCIIEAMKLFNEIESDVSGKVVKILVDNATPVEYDHPLFLVEPS